MSRYVRTGVGLMAAGFLLMLLACASQQTVRENVQDDELFIRAETLYNQGFHTRSFNVFLKYVNAYPRGRNLSTAFYRLGEIYSEQGQYAEARIYYGRLIDRFPESRFAEKARIAVLHSWLKEKQYHRALDYADTIDDEHVSADCLTKKYIAVSDAWMALAVPEKAASSLIFGMSMVGKEYRKTLQARFMPVAEKLDEENLQQLLTEVIDPEIKGFLTGQIAGRQVQEQEDDHEQAVGELPDVTAGGQFQEEELERPVIDLPGVTAEEPKSAPAEEAAASGYYAIGCLLPLSGGYQLFGERALNGILLAFQEVAAASSRDEAVPPIKLVIGDTGSTPEQALEAVRELADKKVAAIIGPLNSFRDAIQEAENSRIPIITLCQEEDIPAMGRYVFRNFLTPRMQIEALARYACRTMGLRRFAVLYPDEEYGKVFAGKFRDEIGRYGGRMVGFESYDPKETDFAKPIKRLAGMGFEALFIPDGPSNAGMIIPQLAYHDVERVLLLGTNLWYSPDLIRAGERFARGAVLPADFWDTGLPGTEQSFSFRYESLFGEKPGFVSAVAYDTAAMLMNILVHPDARYPDLVIDQLEHMERYPGVTGMTSFDASGEVIKPLTLVMIQDNSFVRIEEEGYGTAPEEGKLTDR